MHSSRTAAHVEGQLCGIIFFTCWNFRPYWYDSWVILTGASYNGRHQCEWNISYRLKQGLIPNAHEKSRANHNVSQHITQSRVWSTMLTDNTMSFDMLYEVKTIRCVISDVVHCRDRNRKTIDSFAAMSTGTKFCANIIPLRSSTERLTYNTDNWDDLAR